MNEARIQAIAEALGKNDELRKAVLAMEPAEAAEALKKEGYDFTADELVEFGKLISAATGDGELNVDDLDSVAGGVLPAVVAAAFGVLGTGFAIKVSYDVGKAIGKKAW